MVKKTHHMFYDPSMDKFTQPRVHIVGYLSTYNTKSATNLGKRVQKCRKIPSWKIRGLGCVNQARTRARGTQPSLHIFPHICTLEPTIIFPVAEIHMRQIHGEGGGKEVLCTYCGEGFTTSTRARQHEVKVHLEDNSSRGILTQS